MVLGLTNIWIVIIFVILVADSYFFSLQYAARRVSILIGVGEITRLTRPYFLPAWYSLHKAVGFMKWIMVAYCLFKGAWIWAAFILALPFLISLKIPWDLPMHWKSIYSNLNSYKDLPFIAQDYKIAIEIILKNGERLALAISQLQQHFEKEDPDES